MLHVAVLWDHEVEWDRDTPFDYATDETYAYFSELAEERDIKLFVAKYNWYKDGELKKAWKFNEKWEKTRDIEVDVVHDKFKTDEETLKLKKKISEEIGIINEPELEVLCKDKLEAFKRFPEYVPETKKASRENIQTMREKYGKVVLKPRRAYGAEGIYIIEEGEEIPNIENDEYIVQRFINSSEGIEGVVEGSHDLRGIVVNGELTGSYIRFNEDGEISNISEGGTIKALNVEEIPEKASEIIDEVTEDMDYSPSIFSVDFFYDEKGEPWIVELNSKPALHSFGDEKVKKQVTPIMEELLDSWKMLAES